MNLKIFILTSLLIFSGLSLAKVVSSDEAVLRLGPRVYFKSDVDAFVRKVSQLTCLIEDNYVERLVNLTDWEVKRLRSIKSVKKKKRKAIYQKVFEVLQAGQFVSDQKVRVHAPVWDLMKEANKANKCRVKWPLHHHLVTLTELEI